MNLYVKIYLFILIARIVLLLWSSIRLQYDIYVPTFRPIEGVACCNAMSCKRVQKRYILWFNCNRNIYSCMLSASNHMDAHFCLYATTFIVFLLWNKISVEKSLIPQPPSLKHLGFSSFSARRSFPQSLVVVGQLALFQLSAVGFFWSDLSKIGS